MGSPIRCLDELYDHSLSSYMEAATRLLTRFFFFFVSYSDVYMDHVNRKMSIDMLVSFTCPKPAWKVAKNDSR